MINSNTRNYGLTNNIKNNVIDFIILTLFILYTAATSTPIANNTFSITVTIFLGLVFFKRKRKIDVFIIVVLSVWCIINWISAIVNENQYFSVLTFFGFTMRIIMSYLMIKTIGTDFFDKLYKYAYKLTIIATIIYVFNYVFPSLFSSLAPYLNFITADAQKISGGWYIFVYLCSAWASPERNCGFMWEPGAFAFMLIFLMLLNLMKNKFKLNKQFFVLVIALITTFSTGGYLALFVIILFLLIIQNQAIIGHKTNIAYKAIFPFLLAFFLIGSLYLFNTSIFLKDKIEGYIEQGTESSDWNFEDLHMLRVSRLGIAIIELDSSMNWPFGNGILQSDYVLGKYGDASGPNSLADIVRQWGWLGLCVLIYSFYKFTSFYTKSKAFLACFILSMGVVLFSNPFLFKYLVYGMMFYVMCYKNGKNCMEGAH